MSTLTPHCGRPRDHADHDVITSDNPEGFRCPGLRPVPARSLAELLDRRPELGDLTSMTVANRMQVACA